MDKESAILIIDENIDISGHKLPSNDLNSAQNELQFQSFVPSTQSQTKINSKSSSVYSAPAFDDTNAEEEDVLLGQSPDKSKHTSVPFWQLDYFAQYFDVTTRQVLSRILWSTVPLVGSSKGNFVERHIQTVPDLYGPVWISSTLVFSIAICGNIVNYFDSFATTGAADHEWHYDFTKVRPTDLTASVGDWSIPPEQIGLAAWTIFMYVLCVPICLWFLFWFRGCSANYSLLETVCAYGYSLSVYIPISILWLINIRLIQLILLSLGALLSGCVLLLSFAPVVHSDPSKTIKSSYLILILIVLMHALLAFSFLEYFFWVFVVVS